MSNMPRSSPWGGIQYAEEMLPGVYAVSTASNGGTMVAKEVAREVVI